MRRHSAGAGKAGAEAAACTGGIRTPVLLPGTGRCRGRAESASASADGQHGSLHSCPLLLLTPAEGFSPASPKHRGFASYRNPFFFFPFKYHSPKCLTYHGCPQIITGEDTSIPHTNVESSFSALQELEERTLRIQNRLQTLETGEEQIFSIRIEKNSFAFFDTFFFNKLRKNEIYSLASRLDPK